MTNKERRMAAIEELKLLLPDVKRIRDKYGLACVEVRARNFFDGTGNFSVITADDDLKGVEVGEAYGLSWHDYEDELPNDYKEWIRQADEKEVE